MRVGILGPLRVVDGERQVELTSARQRAVLAALAVRVGGPASVDWLIDAIWGTTPPATALKTLRTHVSRLRDVLGRDVIVTDPAGYRLCLAPDDVDVHRLESLVGAGRRAAEAGAAEQAHDSFAAAERLWRGEPLLELADTAERQGHVARFRELVTQARLGRIDADLALGRHDQAVGELGEWVEVDPLDEPYWERFVLALYRSGRQIDALRAARRARDTLREEAGLEPSPGLQRLEWQVLTHDSRLDLTAPAPASVLPESVDSFVDRDDDVAAVVELVHRYRLVTLHGPGGVGKSRLALEAARRLSREVPDGARWVDLTAARDRDEAVSILAADLDVTPTPGCPLVDMLADRLRHRALLVVLDNCEQGAEDIAAVCSVLLRAAPSLRFLATSRVVLGAAGEHRVTVSPLPTPGPDAAERDVLATAAVRLFLDRAAAQAASGTETTDLRAIAELTRRLDGLPLAIELAAARTRHLTPAEISDHLTERLSVLASGGESVQADHHRTMVAGIEWSYDLLDPISQHLFDLLSVMPDDFDLPAVEELATIAGLAPGDALDHLGRLIDASMVATAAGGDHVRYRVLLLLRQYGRERLAARGEEAAAQRAHADHYRAVAVAAGAGIDGAAAGVWWERVAAERVHLRVAVEWSLLHDDPEVRLDFARLLARASETVVHADFARVVELFRALLDGADEAPPAARGWAWLGTVGAAYLAGDLDLALVAGHTALSLFSAADDRAGLAAAQSNLAFAQLLGAGDTDRAGELFAAAELAARDAGASALEAMSAAGAVQSRLVGNEPLDSIEPLLVRSEELPDGGWATLRAHRAMNRFYFGYRAGDLDGAERAARRAREFSEVAGSSIYEQSGLVGLGLVALERGDLDRARGHLLHAARIAADVSNEMQLGAALMALAATADAAGEDLAAARLYGAGMDRAPTWPFVAARWFPSRAADALGDRFDDECKSGRELTVRQLLDLAVG